LNNLARVGVARSRGAFFVSFDKKYLPDRRLRISESTGEGEGWAAKFIGPEE
jgi:hypothetical protein